MTEVIFGTGTHVSGRRISTFEHIFVPSKNQEEEAGRHWSSCADFDLKSVVLGRNDLVFRFRRREEVEHGSAVLLVHFRWTIVHRIGFGVGPTVLFILWSWLRYAVCVNCSVTSTLDEELLNQSGQFEVYCE